MGMMGALLFFWIFPITGLASLLSYKEIKKSMPWLGRLIDSNERVRAVVQNSLPSVAMITLNALLPFVLEGKCRDPTGCKPFLIFGIAMTYLQGYRARSWIEYSLLKKCVNSALEPRLTKSPTFTSDTSCSCSSTSSLYSCSRVHIGNLFATSPIHQQRSLKNWPRLCSGDQRGWCISTDNAFAGLMQIVRHFFLSYVILQGFGIMPLQLLNLGVIIPSAVMRLFVTRTPRGAFPFYLAPSVVPTCP